MVDGEGRTHTPKVAQNHSFWNATTRAWVDAADLNVGDKLYSPDRGDVRVQAVTSYTGLRTMHDLTIADVHTYYVLAGTTPVLVHNCTPAELDPNKVRFSQDSVNDAAEIIDSMRSGGWRGDPIDVVAMPDGELTTIDNTRVVAARHAGINVRAMIHGYDEALPADQIGRFMTRRGVPATWGDAIALRIGKQKSPFRRNHPSGSPYTSWDGS